ncbi:MAG: zinc ribbon domain-containing protein [Thermodesulfobacteriota bacterium]
MPIYEYRCRACGRIFECLVTVSSGSQQQTCRYCGSQETDKTFSAFSCRSGSAASLTSSGGGGCSPRGGFK